MKHLRPVSLLGLRLAAASLLLLWGSVCCDYVAAQSPSTQPSPSSSPSPLRPVTHATSIILGSAYQQDTYLSPLQYDGAAVSLLHETQRPTRLLGGRVCGQSLSQATFTSAESPASNADYLGGHLHYDYGWHYNWHPSPHWRLMAGPQLGGTLGFLYNTRNGNNPAQAIANIRLGISAAAIWRFHLWRRDFALRDQLDYSLLGAMFSPAYGQSYYEIFSLGQYDHNVRFTHPGNARRVRNQFTLDIACRRTVLRVGYYLDVQESHVNDIRHSDYSIGLVLGWVRRLRIERPARTLPQ